MFYPFVVKTLRVWSSEAKIWLEHDHNLLVARPFHATGSTPGGLLPVATIAFSDDERYIVQASVREMANLCDARQLEYAESAQQPSPVTKDMKDATTPFLNPLEQTEPQG